MIRKTLKTKIPCSVGILTFNSEKTLRRCLESVKDFAEIIICDGGSNDKTLEIAREYNCKIIFQDKKYKNPDHTINDFSGVRNQCLDTASYEWFLYVDSDEYLSNELVEEIREITQRDAPEFYIYFMPRKYVINNRIIDCATTYPNYQIRFFNKRAVEKFIKKVHEKINVKQGYLLGKLKNYEYIPLYEIKDLLKRWDYELKLETEINKNLSLKEWFFKIFIRRILVSGLYLLRLIKIFLFCGGNKMPLKYEVIRHWYHFKLVILTFKKIIKQ